MTTTNFVNGITLTDDDWFNDVDALTYEGTFPSGPSAVVVTGATTLAVFNTVATTINAFGAATTVSIGAGAASTLNANFTTAINLNTGAVVSNQTTVAVFNTTSTTVNAFGAASVALNIGNASAAAAFPGGITPAKLVDISGAAAGQIKFPATQNASSNANTLDDYQETSFTATGTGWDGSVTGTAYYTKIGNQIVLRLPFLTGTSNATTKTITGLPAEAYPTTAFYFSCLCQNNSGADVAAAGQIASGTGVITLYPTAALGSWTASGTAAMRSLSLAYSLV